jgi:hypothetical protein
MRYAKLAFALLGLAALLIAAEPFAGTWKLNLEKSKYKTGTAPKEQTLTITEAGSDLVPSLWSLLLAAGDQEDQRLGC